MARYGLWAAALLPGMAWAQADSVDQIDRLQAQLARQETALLALRNIVEISENIADHGPAALRLLEPSEEDEVAQLREVLREMAAQKAAEREPAAPAGRAVPDRTATPRPAPPPRPKTIGAEDVVYVQMAGGKTGRPPK